MNTEASSPSAIFPPRIGRSSVSRKRPTIAAAATSTMVAHTPAIFRRSGNQLSRLSVRSSKPIDSPIQTAGCGRRRQIQSGSPISASNASAAATTKSVSSQTSTSALHALKLRRQTIQRLRQHRPAAVDKPFRNHHALRGRIEALKRGVQQERAALVLGNAAILRHQNEIGPQADDGFKRRKI